MDLQRWVEEAAARHAVPGAAVAVWAGGELFEAATGVVNRDTGVATTTDSVFQIGSVTKIWTAALVMQLVGEGLVDLDAPVRRYLPEFGVVDPVATETVTVRQLLSHSGGFDGDLFEDFGRGDDALGRLLEFMHTGARQVHPPGALFSYANSGFCVLGALVAKFRGGTWEAAMRNHLLEPLGVSHMALFADEAILFRAAAGHRAGDGRVLPRWQLPRSNAPACATPCAAPRELIRLGRMFLADGVAEDGTRVLPAGTFARMLEPQIDTPDLGRRGAVRWGLGFSLFDWDGVPVAGHDGGTLGQSACWRLVPERDVIIATSANGGESGAFHDAVLAPVLAETAGLTVPARLLPPAEPVPFEPDRCVGAFESPLVRFDVRAVDGGLEVTATPRGVAAAVDDEPVTLRYVALGGDRFVAAEAQDGVHPVAAFLHDGRYLFHGRAVPRV
ncbi:serine hydrolase domain-containing protein [Paractinoplanes ferrugineus]|uniref:Serine hydrolase n=1 Tax=Paractinoplanes ferrugineus TaxID=113564 RepID=A0A919J633_9ACTN|nr:serine hydrolase domain-containing protein [Actinoplanes ferrugineus]GIE11271.1 serine hydrolase [Actinoplanes ferrugineus]